MFLIFSDASARFATSLDENIGIEVVVNPLVVDSEVKTKPQTEMDNVLPDKVPNEPSGEQKVVVIWNINKEQIQHEHNYSKLP